MQRANADHVGLQVGQLGLAHPPTGDAVDLRALFEGGHPFEFHGGGRDDQLAALGEPDAVLPAEVLGGTFTRLAERRLQAAGLVVDPGVDHPAVVARLVHADRGLGFEHHHGRFWVGGQQVISGRQPDDAGADHAVAVVAHDVSISDPLAYPFKALT